MMRCIYPIALAAVAAILFSGCHRQPTLSPLPGTTHPQYSISDIGAGMPSSINNKGQIVGVFAAGVFPNSKGFPYFHGCLWDKGKRTEMKTLGGWYSSADRINDNGQIIGTATVQGHSIKRQDIEHGCLWQDGKLTDLENEPRFRGTGILHLTKSGGVYAVSPRLSPKKQVHLWFYPNGFAPGIRQDKGIIGGPEVMPVAINDSGMVVGNWNTGKKRNKMSIHHAFLWRIGQKKGTDLGTLGGLRSEATALNNAGQIVGNSDLRDDPASPRARTHSFVWEQGKMYDLGALAGGSFSDPYAINDKGQIVGFSEAGRSAVEFHPVLWENGKIKDLSLLIPTGTQWTSLSGVASINDRGQIVGDGSIEGEHWAHGYLLTPLASTP